jgi:hypothetical protein
MDIKRHRGNVAEKIGTNPAKIFETNLRGATLTGRAAISPPARKNKNRTNVRACKALTTLSRVASL